MRHDFGYRNYGREGLRLYDDQGVRFWIDQRLHEDMYQICLTRYPSGGGDLDGCRRGADVIYWGVRFGGGGSFS